MGYTPSFLELIDTYWYKAGKINQLERKLAEHDQQIVSLIKAIKKLLSPSPIPKKRQIGLLPKSQ
ncbi:DUF4615 domain-containing protein [Desulfobacterota bacterium AH_259_B03_O07]|nr:DUF4615 domain-containing protein [Desulfobacterota bacterium AH_259_B03_O07]